MVVVGDQEPLGDLRRLDQTLYICRKWRCFEVEAGRLELQSGWEADSQTGSPAGFRLCREGFG